MEIARQRKINFEYDRWILICSIALVAIGLLMVASSSIVISDEQHGYPFYYVLRQGIFLSIGLFLAYFVLRVPLSLWQKMSGYLLLGCLVLLVAVLIPGIGHQVNGSWRWIRLGPLSMQISELAKLAVIIYLASYLLRHDAAVRTQIIGFVKPLLLLVIIAGLLLLEPDFGATAVIVSTAMGMMFLAGVRLRQFVILLLIVVAILAFIAISSPYRLQRLTTFLNPWANPFGSGYQLTQSLIAFGRGGVLGVGLGNSVQKLFYLPEAHTDFLFAVLAEELGLVGELLVICLFGVLVWRALDIGSRAQKAGNMFAAQLAYGFSLWIGFQAMVNIGVNAGILPTKGLTLPLMSYGGSSMMVNCIVIAILLRIAHEMKFNHGVSGIGAEIMNHSRSSHKEHLARITPTSRTSVRARRRF